MKIINLTRSTLADANFQEVRVSKYYRARFEQHMRPLLMAVKEDGCDNDIQQLLRHVTDLDENTRCMKVVIPIAILLPLRKRIARLFMEREYEVYVANLDGTDCTYLDPRGE